MKLLSTTAFALLLAAGCTHKPLLAPLPSLAPESVAQTRELGAVDVFERHREALRDSIVRLALRQVGTPYVFGGEDPTGFDCSGLVAYVFARVHLEPPRTARQQARVGASITRDALRRGDLLAFGIGDSITHIGIYVGERKFVHASSVAGRVIVSSIDRPPSDLIRPLRTARRLLLAPEAIVAD